MKSRSNITQVANIAESKSRLIEGTVIKVYPQTRTAQVRLDGSSQYTTINLGAIDPSLVSTSGSRVLLYNASGILYAISVVPGQHMKSSPGNTLGDSGGSTRLTVYNAQNTEVAHISSTGEYGVTRDSVRYTGYIFVPFTEPLTHTSFNGDSFSDVASRTKIENTSWSTAIPADAKALLIRMRARDSGSAAGLDLYFGLYSTAAGTNAAVAVWPCGITSNALTAVQGIVPCTDGDIWYKCNASGASTMDVWLYCVGYWI